MRITVIQFGSEASVNMNAPAILLLEAFLTI